MKEDQSCAAAAAAADPLQGVGSFESAAASTQQRPSKDNHAPTLPFPTTKSRSLDECTTAPGPTPRSAIKRFQESPVPQLLVMHFLGSSTTTTDKVVESSHALLWHDFGTKIVRKRGPRPTAALAEVQAHAFNFGFSRLRNSPIERNGAVASIATVDTGSWSHVQHPCRRLVKRRIILIRIEKDNKKAEIESKALALKIRNACQSGLFAILGQFLPFSWLVISTGHT